MSVRLSRRISLAERVYDAYRSRENFRVYDEIAREYRNDWAKWAKAFPGEAELLSEIEIELIENA